VGRRAVSYLEDNVKLTNLRLIYIGTHSGGFSTGWTAGIVALVNDAEILLALRSYSDGLSGVRSKVNESSCSNLKSLLFELQ
jgi:hypothetical protein